MTYVTHNGVGSALVRSQVLPYLRALEAEVGPITLVSYDRGERFPDDEFPRQRWIGLRPGSGAGIATKARDALSGAWTLVCLAIRGRADVFHARSYLPAAMALVAGAITRRPFIFDMRGFLGEEYVDGGHWEAGDRRYRILRFVERILLRRAAEVIVLTERAVERLRNEPHYAGAVRSPITVVPCAIDLARFRPVAERSIAPTVVYSGSLGMWYLLDEMLQVFAYARESVRELRFQVLSRTDHGLVRSAAAAAGVADGVEVLGADPADVPAHLARAHVGIALLRQVPSKLGSSPVKVAEYLACGLPVIVNADLGDSDRLVVRYAAGHVVPRYDEASLRAAGHALVGLLSDSVARANARRLAEEVYDLDSAVGRYVEVYRHLEVRMRKGRTDR